MGAIIQPTTTISSATTVGHGAPDGVEAPCDPAWPFSFLWPEGWVQGGRSEFLLMVQERVTLFSWSHYS